MQASVWIGDVGQNEFEEINVIGPNDGGTNFGWSVNEGPFCYIAESCDSSGLVEPVFSYTHISGESCSVTGGYVSRGEGFADLYGIYVLADYYAGLLWGGSLGADGTYVFSLPVETGLYIFDLNGGVYELVPPI